MNLIVKEYPLQGRGLQKIEIDLGELRSDAKQLYPKFDIDLKTIRHTVYNEYIMVCCNLIEVKPVSQEFMDLVIY